jgi:hypothetical protein
MNKICCKILKLRILTKHRTCVSNDYQNLAPSISINGINRLEFIMDTDCVLCDVGTDFLRTI